MRLFRRKPRTDQGMSPSSLNNYLRAIAAELRYDPPYFWLGSAAE